MLVPPVALVLPLFLEVTRLGQFNSPGAFILASALFPFGTFLAYIYFVTSIPNELYEAAKIDGSGEYQTFWRIALPLARPLLGILAFFAFVGHLDQLLPAVRAVRHERRTTRYRSGSGSSSRRRRR